MMNGEIYMKTYTGYLTLSTPQGDIEEHYTLTEKERGGEVYIKLELFVYGNDFEGEGRDLSWADAFASLQKSLPGGFSIKCCRTCRHGHDCPYGNLPDTLFCSHGAEIKSKSELVDFICGTDEGKIIHSAFDVCENFTPQSKEHYTYSDYLYYLEGKSDV